MSAGDAHSAEVGELAPLAAIRLEPRGVYWPHGHLDLVELPDAQPEHPSRLGGVSPLIERLWRLALLSVERNIVHDAQARYFGAGRAFGTAVFTRDISYAGVLALSRLYPGLMRASLDHAVRQRLRLGYATPRVYHVPQLDAPWVLEDVTDRQFTERHGTSGFLRRTDEVVWLWAADDLLRQTDANETDRCWLYDLGCRSFKELYAPLFDPADGLYRGQASFIDVHFPHKKAAGYPLTWSIADCLLQKATSTNALYVHAMRVLARTATALGLSDQAEAWRRRAEELASAMRRELCRGDGTWVFYKDARGRLSERREALGAALVVLLDVVDGDAAKAALCGYPASDRGIPLFWPFFDDERCYHNNTAWPFVEALFLQAWDKVTGARTPALTLALTARSCTRQAWFQEFVDYRTGRPGGSADQLWTAAAFLGACLDPALPQGHRGTA